MGNNDYNYYKNEYSKYKNNYYSPSTQKKHFDNSKRKKIMRKRFFRAFLVFFIIFAVIAALVFGGIKMYSYFKDKKPDDTLTTIATTVEKTTVETTTIVDETTTVEESTTEVEETTTTESTTKTTTKSNTQNIISIGSHQTNTAYYLDTDSGVCVNLRVGPNTSAPVLRLLVENTKVVFSKFSDDKKWGYTSNLPVNGWIALEFARYKNAGDNSSSNTNTNNKTTTYYAPTTSLKYYSNSYAQNTPSFNDALAIFGADKSNNLYLNCKVSTSTKIIGRDVPSDTAKQIATFSNGTSLKIYSVRYGYGRTRVNGKDVWLPTSCLQFVSWGHYY